MPYIPSAMTSPRTRTKWAMIRTRPNANAGMRNKPVSVFCWVLAVPAHLFSGMLRVWLGQPLRRTFSHHPRSDL
jgi:hypothetical protein